MKRLEPMVKEVAIRPFVTKLAASETADLYALFHFMLFDVIGHLVFSRDFGLACTGDHPIVQWLGDGQAYSILKAIFPPVQYLGQHLGGSFGKSGYDALNAFCQELIEERRRGEPKQDILQDFLGATYEDGTPFSDKDIVSEMVMQVLAGTDTTANTMTWTMKLLLDNPPEMEKLVAELDAAFPSPDDISVEAVRERCSYLDAVISESMRLFPVGAGHLARIVPAGGVEFDGYHVPGGTECGVTTYAYHRSAKIWEDPNAFRPARFLGPNSAEVKAKFLPFLNGPRSCTGREMAWMTMYLTLPNLLRRFRVSWHDPRLTVTPIYYLVLRPKESKLLVDVSPRS